MCLQVKPTVHVSSGNEARKPVNVLVRAILRHWVTSSKSYDVEFRKKFNQNTFCGENILNILFIASSERINWNF